MTQTHHVSLGPAPVIGRRKAGRAPVSVSERWDDRTLPALVQAAVPGADLAAWIRDNKTSVDRLAHQAGAVLFRGFEVPGAEAFRTAMSALSPTVLDYGERSSPRSEVTNRIYTSTEHPADQRILLHNEQSYTVDWPTRIVFYCERAATRGGRTPLADSRRVLARLRPEMVAKFVRLGVSYVRNYLPGISLSWQEAFQTDRREDVAAYCRRADITAEWVSENHLRTRQVRPAVRTHPLTGEQTWFNHAVFFHVTSLPEEVAGALLASLPEQDLPYHTFYGDGTPIEDVTLAEIRAALEAETTAFDWRPADVLLVENMLCAHAREPFEGPRRILTAMADPISTFGRTA
ncbi:TauD/TfdA family dioxygenase [Streptomyces sp. RPA4-5]|uniref:TauD/TfdA family dioxygenase n=1 Tax=Streptomyces sp. RPA4-5 TaxID=2721245 RepID=UPI00143ED4B7|nr:TauD/TfdA family dioxygenase [Streptomyces sp. RPA4-5]QIY54439.1 TauD/TfdA family dioxygenase [Streptomyces sp. RPA4-5]